MSHCSTDHAKCFKSFHLFCFSSTFDVCFVNLLPSPPQSISTKQRHVKSRILGSHRTGMPSQSTCRPSGISIVRCRQPVAVVKRHKIHSNVRTVSLSLQPAGIDIRQRKAVPVHTMITFRESRGIAPLILNLGTRRR